MLDVITDLAKKYKIKSVYLFGSYARNEANENSDIDLVVDNTDSLAFGIDFFKLHCELEDALQKKVDLLTMSELEQPNSYLAKKVKSNFMKDRILIYEV